MSSVADLMGLGTAPAVAARLGFTAANADPANTCGTFTCNGASNVTITTTAASTTMIWLPSLKTVGGTVGNTPKVTTITAGTSFTVAGSASDTSVYNWILIPIG